MSSRDQILAKLREGKRPFPTITRPDEYQAMIPISDASTEALLSRFMDAAKKVDSQVIPAPSPETAIAEILNLLGEESHISGWDPLHIPLPGLAKALADQGIAIVGQDADVQFGLTGVDAALAATGSLLLMSGNGRPRAASLLPPVHIAVVTAGQIYPGLESWWADQKASGLAQIQRHSNIVAITGPSRTSDIAMQTVMGMHGPRELHIILLPDF